MEFAREAVAGTWLLGDPRGGHRDVFLPDTPEPGFECCTRFLRTDYGRRNRVASRGLERGRGGAVYRRPAQQGVPIVERSAWRSLACRRPGRQRIRIALSAGLRSFGPSS